MSYVAKFRVASCNIMLAQIISLGHEAEDHLIVRKCAVVVTALRELTRQGDRLSHRAHIHAVIFFTN